MYIRNMIQTYESSGKYTLKAQVETTIQLND